MEERKNNISEPLSDQSSISRFNRTDHTSPWQHGFDERMIYPSSFQMMSDDINCGSGFGFLFRNTYLHENDPKWLFKFIDRPGITRWMVSKDTGRRVRNAMCEDDWDKAANCGQVRFKAKIAHQGNFFNLGGNHHSSASASASIDLANLLIFGSEQVQKPLCILSKMEAWAALNAANVPGIFTGGVIEPYKLRNTESEKFVFESAIQRALESVGGRRLLSI